MGCKINLRRKKTINRIGLQRETFTLCKMMLIFPFTESFHLQSLKTIQIKHRKKITRPGHHNPLTRATGDNGSQAKQHVDKPTKTQRIKRFDPLCIGFHSVVEESLTFAFQSAPQINLRSCSKSSHQIFA